MKKILWIFALTAWLPAMAGAQETKLVNCRALKETGNYIHADEVLVHSMICKVVKVSPAAGAADDKQSKPSPEVMPQPASPPAKSRASEAKPVSDALSRLAVGETAVLPEKSSEATQTSPDASTETGPAHASADSAPAASMEAAPVAEPAEASKAAPSEATAEPAAASTDNAPIAAAPATEAPAATSSPMAPPDDPNAERPHTVQMGTFGAPPEEKPEPQVWPREDSFQPTEEDGFQEGQRPGCTKNITLGGLQGDKLVLGIPEWATKWIEKNQQRMPQTCFSDTPMAGAKNYLIVFYTPSAIVSGQGLTNADLNSLHGTPASGVGAFTTKYGVTWHYAYDRTVGVTINSRNAADQPYSQPGQVQYATAYTEDGVPVSEHWPDKQAKQTDVKSKKQRKNREAMAANEKISDELLSQLVGDIGKL